MGLLSTDYIRLDIAMEFSVRARSGRGAARFIQVEPHPILSSIQASIAAAAMNYARALVNQAESREPLFYQVVQASDRLIAGGDQPLFSDWPLEVGGTTLWIWPWQVVEYEDLASPSTYIATLQGSRRGGLFIHLKMAWGQEHVLAPAAALLPIEVLGTRYPRDAAALLGRTLRAINEFYGSPTAASRLGSEPAAMAAALPVLLGQ